jgi:thiamine transporter
VRLRGHAGADPLNLIRVMPAQGGFGISYRRIPVDRKEGALLNAFRDTRVLTEAALAVALSFVLGFIVLFKMPFGGSVSLEMIPLILLALRQGWKVGVLAGAAYGLLDLAIDPYVVHPVQLLLDYPLAFGALGLAGLFKPTVRGAILGATVAVLARFLCHLLSGVVFFASYAPEGWNPFLYSAAYNAAYLLPSLAIAVVVTVVLLKALEGARPSPRQLQYRRSMTS